MAQISKNVAMLPAQQILDVCMSRFTSLYSGHERQAEKVFERCISHSLGIKEKHKPVGTCMSIGPSGSGKSYFWECIAESLHGQAGSLIMLNGGEYQHSHEIAKLIGAPPGYLGHKETEAVITNKAMIIKRGLSQFAIDFIVVDELDKAHGSVCDFFLSPMEKAQAKLASGGEVDFSDCFIAFTTNAGENIYAKKEIGLSKSSIKPGSSHRKSLLKRFSSPFLNRVKDFWVFDEYDQKQKFSAIKIQVGRLLQSYDGNSYNSGIIVSNGFLDEVSGMKMDKDFGMRDLVRTAKLIVEQRCTDLAFGRTKKKTLGKEDVIEFIKRRDESGKSLSASM